MTFLEFASRLITDKKKAPYVQWPAEAIEQDIEQNLAVAQEAEIVEEVSPEFKASTYSSPTSWKRMPPPWSSLKLTR
jgi:hypothetical protein